MKSNTSKISVAMATYNGEKFIAEQLDSILAQDFALHEIVICDDQSNDSTVDILKSYAAADSRITVIQNEKNLGYVKNFEKACSLCTGEYIALSDQDDIWAPKKLTKLLEGIRANESLSIYSNAILIDKKGRALRGTLWDYVLKATGGLPPDNINHQSFYITNCATGCTMLVDRDLLDLAMPFPKDVPHDWWLAYISASKNRLAFLNSTLTNYRQHSSNVYGINAKPKNKFDPLFRIQKKITRYTKSLPLEYKQKQIKYATPSRLQHMKNYELRQFGSNSTELEILIDYFSAANQPNGKNISLTFLRNNNSHPILALSRKIEIESDDFRIESRKRKLRIIRKYVNAVLIIFLILTTLSFLLA